MEPLVRAADGLTEVEAQKIAQFATTDIVWRNVPSGQVAYWNMIGTEIGSSGYHQPVSGNDWRLEGTADFNADGVFDFVWRNYVTGENAVWILNEQGGIASVSYLPPLADASWQLVGAVDMNRDGYADLLWRNTASGQNAIWYLNGVALLRGVFVQTLPDQNWKLRGAGDLDGDGRPELIWRNAASGENAAWFLTGGDNPTIERGVFLTPVADRNWQLETVADVDGDRKADFLWRNLSTGETAVWFMDGTTIAQGSFLQAVADPNWRIVGTRRRATHGFEFDAKPGTSAYNSGIRSWLVKPAATPTEKTTFYASDGTRTLSTAQMVLPRVDDRSPSEVEATTQAAFIDKLAVRTWTTTRGALAVPTFDQQRERFSILGADMPSNLGKLRADGGPSLNEWARCQTETATLTRESYLLATAAITCATSTVGVSACVAGSLAWLAPLCAPLAKTAIVSCFATAVQLCSVNSAASEAACCQGESIKQWPVPFTSCLDRTVPNKKCACTEKYPGSHREVRPGAAEGSLPEYQCNTGEYKILVEVTERVAKTPGSGSGPCPLYNPGVGGWTYGAFHGYEERNLGTWDSAPSLAPGDFEVSRGFSCGSGESMREGYVSGVRSGVASTRPGGWTPKFRNAASYAASFNGEEVIRKDEKIACEGWDSGPDSDYAKCAASVKAANGVKFYRAQSEDYRCVVDPCAAVHWNE